MAFEASSNRYWTTDKTVCNLDKAGVSCEQAFVY